MVNGYIVVPDALIKDNFVIKEICDTLSAITNFSIIEYEQFNPSTIKKDDILFLIGIPSNRFNGDKIVELVDKAKMILWHFDLGWLSPKIQDQLEFFINKSLMVITPHYHRFMSLWPLYYHKAEYIPLHAASYLFDVGFNPNPQSKCLFIDETNKLHFLKNKIISSLKNEIELYKCHDYINSKRDQNYSEIINDFFCAVAYCPDLSEFEFPKKIMERDRRNSLYKLSGQVIEKYFEIPASGALLIGEAKNKDLFNMGFEDMKNFVQITSDDAIEKIKDVLNNTQKYDEVRRQGRQFVFDHHTIENRRHLYESIWFKFVKYFG